MGNRESRRQEQRERQRQERQERKAAGQQFERDMRTGGDFNAQRALADPNYMAQVIEYRKRQRQEWEKNGIRKEDLDREYDRGFRAGQRELTSYYSNYFFASVAIALKREFRFGEGRIRRVMEAMKEIMTWEITTCDILDRCMRETGIEIREEGETERG